MPAKPWKLTVTCFEFVDLSQVNLFGLTSLDLAFAGSAEPTFYPVWRRATEDTLPTFRDETAIDCWEGYLAEARVGVVWFALPLPALSDLRVLALLWIRR